MESLCEPYILHKNRYSLLYSLREAGYYVHMHAYEYIIGDGKSLLAVLLLEPLSCKAEVYVVPGTRKGKLSKVIETIEKVLPGVKVFIHAYTH